MTEDELLRELENTTLEDSQAIIRKAERLEQSSPLPALPAPKREPMSPAEMLFWGALGILLGVNKR